MALGPGRYDEECTRAREATGAEAVLLIVIAGKHGHGFSMQTTNPLHLMRIAETLRDVAQKIEEGGIHA